VTEPTDARASPSSPSSAEAPDGAAAAAVLRPLGWRDPLRWLAAGWRDFVRAPGIGAFYGACFIAMGWALLQMYARKPAWTLALSGGFLLMGPFLCLGLHRVSQRLEAGERPDLGDSLLAWDTRTGALAIFGLVLLVLELVWSRAVLVIVAVSFDRMPEIGGSLGALPTRENLPFLATFTLVGAVFATLIFAVSVVAAPMILDRGTDAVSAALVSLRLVLDQPGVMLWWATLIVLIVGLAMLPGFAGLLVAGPVIGHATWHAYRAAVAPPAAGP
jgi:uncharacterized membrane protein